MGFFATILMGILAGWLAEKVMDVKMGTLKNLLLGLCGSAVGSAVLGLLGSITGKGYSDPTSFIPAVLVAFLGSCLIIWIYKKITGKDKK